MEPPQGMGAPEGMNQPPDRAGKGYNTQEIYIIGGSLLVLLIAILIISKLKTKYKL
jgi:hypothetical protein